jgi:uncharacterized protein YqcC (DUF446 family)
MDHFTHQLADLLLEIEAEMRRIGLWEPQPPPPQALTSLIPFCHDTLRFEQWLQWVLLPKVKQIVESDEECPSSSDITPLAEHRFGQLPQQTAALLQLLERFDKQINREGRLRERG